MKLAGPKRIALSMVIALWCLTSAASAREGPWHIGWLDPSMTPTTEKPSRSLGVFKERLKELGYVEGRDFVMEARFGDTYWDRLPEFAKELVDRHADVIVTIGTRTVMIAKEATTTIPIVMAGAGEPLELGLVQSLARPGGNVTGVAHNPGPEFAGKSLELLKEAVPKISRITILWDSGALHEDPSLEGQRKAAEALGVTLLIHDITDAHDEAAFAGLLSTVESERPDAVFIYPNFIAAKHAASLLAFVSAHRLPLMVQDTSLAERGALFSHYADWDELRRRTAEYVDKILKGGRRRNCPSNSREVSISSST